MTNAFVLGRVIGYEDAADLMCQDFEQRFKLYLTAAETALGTRS